jgi:hypothetical protein
MASLEPEIRTTFRAMLAKASVDESTPMANITKVLAMNGHSNEEMNAYLVAVNTGRGLLMGKFAAKLTFEQRCEILALHRKGCTRENLAKMFGIDRRTVTHIYNPQSPHYRNVREEEKRLGADNFFGKYVSQESMARMIAFGNEKGPDNNKSSNRKAGIHTVQGPMCKHMHRVRIEWKEANDHDIPVSGWYYNDLDSDFPDAWFQTGPDSLKTSQACYTGMLEDISDKIS